MVGPQFRWWVWNENLSTSVPTLAHVPYINLQAFSIALPFAMALVTLWVSKQGRVGGWTVVRNVALVCVLVWPILFLSSLPSLLMALAGVPVSTARIVATWLLIGLACSRRRHRIPAQLPCPPRRPGDDSRRCGRRLLRRGLRRGVPCSSQQCVGSRRCPTTSVPETDSPSTVHGRDHCLRGRHGRGVRRVDRRRVSGNRPTRRPGERYSEPVTGTKLTLPLRVGKLLSVMPGRQSVWGDDRSSFTATQTAIEAPTGAVPPR